MSEPIPQKQLIEAAKRRDMVAVQTIYNNHRETVYRYISLCVPLTDVEEVTADVFIELIRSMVNFEDVDVPLQTWLYRIAAAQVVEYQRRKGMWQTDHFAETDDNPEQRHLRQAIARLTEDDQQVIIVSFAEKRDLEASARLLGKSTTSMKVAQYRALQNLAYVLYPPDLTGDDQPRFSDHTP